MLTNNQQPTTNNKSSGFIDLVSLLTLAVLMAGVAITSYAIRESQETRKYAASIDNGPYSIPPPTEVPAIPQPNPTSDSSILGSFLCYALSQCGGSPPPVYIPTIAIGPSPAFSPGGINFGSFRPSVIPCDPNEDFFCRHRSDYPSANPTPGLTSAPDGGISITPQSNVFPPAIILGSPGCTNDVANHTLLGFIPWYDEDCRAKGLICRNGNCVDPNVPSPSPAPTERPVRQDLCFRDGSNSLNDANTLCNCPPGGPNSGGAGCTCTVGLKKGQSISYGDWCDRPAPTKRPTNPNYNIPLSDCSTPCIYDRCMCPQGKGCASAGSWIYDGQCGLYASPVPSGPPLFNMPDTSIRNWACSQTSTKNCYNDALECLNGSKNCSEECSALKVMCNDQTPGIGGLYRNYCSVWNCN